MDYCPECGEFLTECNCPGSAQLEYNLNDPDTAPELCFDEDYYNG